MNIYARKKASTVFSTTANLTQQKQVSKRTSKSSIAASELITYAWMKRAKSSNEKSDLLPSKSSTSLGEMFEEEYIFSDDSKNNKKMLYSNRRLIITSKWQAFLWQQFGLNFHG